jgi:hypothetical protein
MRRNTDELPGEFVPVRHASLLTGPQRACPGRAIAMIF